MDQVLIFFENLNLGGWGILVGALIMTCVIVVPTYVVEYMGKKKEQIVESKNDVSPPVVKSGAKVKAQLKTLDKAPKGKVTWL